MEMRKSRIGIDAITLNIITDEQFEPKEEMPIERRTDQKKLYLQVDKTKNPNQYELVIVLPCCVRTFNMQGFSVFDDIETAVIKIKSDIQEIFGTKNLKLYVVRKIECNANMESLSEENVDMLLSLIARSLLLSGTSLTEYIRGKKICETSLIREPVINGFKTERNSTARFVFKIYNKGREMRARTNVLRLEIIYNSRGIKHALQLKQDVTLFDILQKESIQKIVNKYIVDVRGSLRPYIRTFLNEAVNLIVKDLKAGYGAYETLLRRRDIWQYDYRIFKMGLKKYHRLKGSNKRTMQIQASRLKRQVQSKGITVYEGAIKELELFFEIIDKQEINIIG